MPSRQPASAGQATWGDIELQRLLLADWVKAQAAAAGVLLTQSGRSGNKITLGDSSTFQITGEPRPAPQLMVFRSNDPARQTDVDRFAAEAIRRVAASDFGDVQWYSTVLFEGSPSPSPRHFFSRTLAKAMSRQPISGWRRLGNEALVEFQQDPADAGKLMEPFNVKAQVAAYLPIPGPCVGFFSDREACVRIELVAATAGFALQCPLDLPIDLRPLEATKVADLSDRLKDPSIGTLARKAVPLDITGWLRRPGGAEAYTKASSALLTMDSALRQESDVVACILYVAAAERLSTPSAPWRQSRVTKRFVTFFEELIPMDLQALVGHQNFEEVIGITRGTRDAKRLRRLLLEKIYSFRSGVVHEGLGFSYRPVIDIDFKDMVRRSMLADFAEAALLGYLRSPRSSLVGSEPRCAGCNGSGVAHSRYHG